MNGARGRKLAEAIVARLRAEPETSDEVFTAFAELDALPEDVVKSALEPWLGSAPDLAQLDDAIRSAHRLPPRKLGLRTLAVTKDADVLFLGEVAEEQLRVAGKSWDGIDLAPEERLDEETEHSFAGTLEHRSLAAVGDATDTPLFDVLRFLGEAGVIFRAGTAVPIGYIADGRIEVADARIRTGLEEALREDAVDTQETEETEEKTPKKPRRKTATATPKAKAKAKATPKKKAATAKKKATATAKKKKTTAK